MTKLPKSSSSAQLLSDFQSAQLAIATVGSLKHTADRAEEDFLKNLNSIGGSKFFLKPDDIPESMHEQYIYASFNAHLQKVQAYQIEIHSQKQLDLLSDQLNQDYVGSKVLIKAIDRKSQPISACWRQKELNRLYISKKHPSFIKGRISGLNLQDNYLIVKPTMITKALKRDLQYYIVQVINQQDFAPLIHLSTS